MGSLAIYWNRQTNLQFLHERCGIASDEHILQANFFIVLQSVEIAVAARLFSILHLAFFVP